jgi:hypothetical protein
MDSSTDWVWHSAGKIVADGYIVEICQSFKNIRFASGKDIRMGVVFWRQSFFFKVSYRCQF